MTRVVLLVCLAAGRPWVACAGNESTAAADPHAFWSFRPRADPAPPSVHDSAWTKTGLDAFILAKLEQQRLRPAAPADRRTLLRRVYIDLWGLLPSVDDVEAFERDRAPDAFRRVVDRLLASPRYGERWARHWLDVARYADDQLDGTPFENSFRYRDWVIKAFNDDLPYDQFVKAQLAGDLLDPAAPNRFVAGLGFLGLSPQLQDDAVDVTTRAFLGLTVACARCHDHRLDPIPQTDFYALQGVFRSTQLREYPIASPDIVRAWDEQKKQVDRRDADLKAAVAAESARLAGTLAARTSRYLVAAHRALAAETGRIPAIVDEDHLDRDVFDRWLTYLKRPSKEHPYLNEWNAARAESGNSEAVRRASEAFQTLALAVAADKATIDQQNRTALGGSPDRAVLAGASLKSLGRDQYYLWTDLFGDRGIYTYTDQTIDRFLSAEAKSRLDALRTEVATLKKEIPPKYAYVHAVRDLPNPVNARVDIRGNPGSPGEEVPRHFLTVLSDGAPQPFVHGAGRLELAEAIASPANPLTARVMVNRIWQHLFGEGIVRTPSDFGQAGDRPTHPELLDYLTTDFVASGWSIKALQRKIVLSATYAQSAHPKRTAAGDPENRLLWRSTPRRLDAETMRDTILQAAGTLDVNVGGRAQPMSDTFFRRTVYGFVSRRKLDPALALFDFPNPNTTSGARVITDTPLQRTFLMNSSFVQAASRAIAARVAAPTDETTIRGAYRLLFQRNPERAELQLGLSFLRNGGTLDQYAQTLITSNEFLFID